MNAVTPTQADAGAKPARKKPRMARKLSAALDMLANEGVTQVQAAKRSGMNYSALSRALQRPEVRQELETRQALFAGEARNLKGIAQTLAYRTGITLMQTSPDHRVRAKMVELFAGETKAPSPITVQTNVFTPGANGYEYLPPGAQIVDITPVEQGSEGSGEGAPIHAEDEGEE